MNSTWRIEFDAERCEQNSSNDFEREYRQQKIHRGLVLKQLLTREDDSSFMQKKVNFKCKFGI